MGFKIVYGLLYAISLLPFWLLYGISDFVAFCLNRIFGYRKKTVLENLEIAFPEKTLEERKLIANKFYRNFTDNFIETIKAFSMTGEELDRRMKVEIDVCNQLAKDGFNVQVNSAHFFNWEWASMAIGKHINLPWLGIYKKIENNVFEKLFLRLRSRFGSIMVSNEEFRYTIQQYFKKQFALGLIADQKPAEAKTAYWTNFFGKKTAFLVGVEKPAMRQNTAVVFAKTVKLKRGYYKAEFFCYTKNPMECKDGELLLAYRNWLEESIRQQPENYLWSHKRFGRIFDPAVHSKRWRE